MKRIAVMVCAVLGLALCSGNCEASWGALSYSGYQPWWNVFAKRYKCLTPEEERLQKFWHDYYDALKCFYCSLDHIDWVAYYKNHGYQINACGPYGGGCGRINYAPVFVSPNLQWAVPAGAAGGPPVGPPYAHGYSQPQMPMYPMGPGHYNHGPVGMAGPMGYPGYPISTGQPARPAPTSTSAPTGPVQAPTSLGPVPGMPTSVPGMPIGAPTGPMPGVVN
jgi:hypothetical protein